MNQVKSLLAITVFVTLGTSAFAGTAAKLTRKEAKAVCVAQLQPPLASGERLSPQQGAKVRECMASKGSEHSKANKPVAQRN